MRPQYYLLFGVMLLVLGAGALVFGIFSAFSESSFASGAETTQAMVVDKAIENRGDDRDHDIVYTFTPPGGAEVTRRQSIGREEWEQLQPGDTIDIQYLPDDPTRNRLAGTGGVVAPIITAVFGAVALPAGVVLTLFAVRRMRRHRRLLGEGIAVEATVIGVEATNVRVHQQQQWAVVYRYTDRTGAEHTGRSDPMPMQSATEWQPGSTGLVRYAAERPEENAWVGRG